MSSEYERYDLKDWVSYFEKTIGAGIRLGLDRVGLAAEKLGLLNPDYKVITVAGTNGKGSSVACLEAIYSAAGYKTGAYTSPHLLKINERIKVNAQSISDYDFCQALSAVKSNTEGMALSYFESLTLAALWHFQSKNLDVVILEVGLGGRLDATNIIDADLAIISTIALDHQHILGETIEEIAYEKAGIMRENKPVIYADANVPNAILSVAQEKNARLYCLDRDYRINNHDNQCSIEFLFEARKIEALNVSSLSAKAMASAILAVRLLQDQLPVTEPQLKQAMQDLVVPGRLQLIPGKVSRLFDVAHNPQATERLADYLSHLPKSGKVHAIFSALEDKNLQAMLSPLKAQVDYWYPCLLKNERALNKDELFAVLNNLEMNYDQCYDSPSQAYREVLKKVYIGDLIVVFGSFYVVSEVMEIKAYLPSRRSKDEIGA